MSEVGVPEPDQLGCGNMRGRAFLNLDTGQVVPARCGRLRCPYCLRVNARRRALAISLARPERAILLTQVGNDWQTIRDRVRKLRYALKSEVGSFEWVYHVETNPKLTGHHVHAWQRGCYISQELLSSKAKSRGCGGVAYINRVRSTVGAGRYGLKGISYGLKGVEAQDEGDQYLQDNGWRLTHQSRGFFRVGGLPVPVRDAERSALGMTEEGMKRWVMIRVDV